MGYYDFTATGTSSGSAGGKNGAYIDLMNLYSPSAAMGTKSALNDDISGRTGAVNSLQNSNALVRQNNQNMQNTAAALNNSGANGQGLANALYSDTAQQNAQNTSDALLKNQMQNIDIRNSAIDRAQNIASENWQKGFDWEKQNNSNALDNLDYWYKLAQDFKASGDTENAAYAANVINSLLSRLTNSQMGDSSWITDAENAVNKWKDGRNEYSNIYDMLELSDMNSIDLLQNQWGINDWQTDPDTLVTIPGLQQQVTKKEVADELYKAIFDYSQGKAYSLSEYSRLSPIQKLIYDEITNPVDKELINTGIQEGKDVIADGNWREGIQKFYGSDRDENGVKLSKSEWAKRLEQDWGLNLYSGEYRNVMLPKILTAYNNKGGDNWKDAYLEEFGEVWKQDNENGINSIDDFDNYMSENYGNAWDYVDPNDPSNFPDQYNSTNASWEIDGLITNIGTSEQPQYTVNRSSAERWGYDRKGGGDNTWFVNKDFLDSWKSSGQYLYDAVSGIWIRPLKYSTKVIDDYDNKGKFTIVYEDQWGNTYSYGNKKSAGKGAGSGKKRFDSDAESLLDYKDSEDYTSSDSGMQDIRDAISVLLERYKTKV